MAISEEDRKAFHNQADRVLDLLNFDFDEVGREDKDRAVTVTLATDLGTPEMKVAKLKIAPNHRFVVFSVLGNERETFYRRDDAADFINDIL